MRTDLIYDAYSDWLFSSDELEIWTLFYQGNELGTIQCTEKTVDIRMNSGIKLTGDEFAKTLKLIEVFQKTKHLIPNESGIQTHLLETEQIKINNTNFPRIWEYFPFILSKKVRKEVYDPALEELKEDFLIAKSMRKSKWAKRWINFCFTARTAGLVCQTLSVSMSGMLKRSLLFVLLMCVGPRAINFVRERWAELFGRLP